MFGIGDVLKDAGAVTSSGYGEVDAAAKVVNLGAGLVRGNCIIDVTAMVMQGNDQVYQIHLMGGDDESFTKEVALATLEVGVKETIEGNLDSKLARYVMPFENEQNGITYPYVRVRHVISGTSPSINYSCRMEKDLPVRGLVSAQTTTTT